MVGKKIVMYLRRIGKPNTTQLQFAACSIYFIDLSFVQGHDFIHSMQTLLSNRTMICWQLLILTLIIMRKGSN